MNERRYSEEEVAEILRRAVESKGALARRSDARGLTLTELTEIASEVGIDPARVEHAAVTLSMTDRSRPSALLGTPLAPQYEIRLRRHVKPEEFGDLVDAIRRSLGRQGIVREELGALEWKARDAMGGRYVSVRPKGGETVIRAFGNFRDGAAVHLGGGALAGLALGAMLTTFAGLTAMGVPLAIVAAAAAGALIPGRLLWKWRYRSEDEALRRVIDELSAQLSEGGSEPAE